MRKLTFGIFGALIAVLLVSAPAFAEGAVKESIYKYGPIKKGDEAIVGFVVLNASENGKRGTLNILVQAQAVKAYGKFDVYLTGASGVSGPNVGGPKKGSDILVGTLITNHRGKGTLKAKLKMTKDSFSARAITIGYKKKIYYTTRSKGIRGE